MVRIQAEYPSATLLDKKDFPPDNKILNAMEQHFHVVSVRAIPNFSHLKHVKMVIPDTIANFYEANDVNTFEYDRPYHKGIKDPNNEFKSLWLERSVYETQENLPGILRWSLVIKT